MDIKNIKGYVERRLEILNDWLPSERTYTYYDEKHRLQHIWVQAEQAEMQVKRIEQADTQNALLLRIALAIESLNPGR